jgi:fatty acid desaturase
LILIKYLGVHIFEEARSSKNRPHQHIYTKIRNQWYDFAKFDHPGGPVALYLAKDRDATALFESHHLLADQGRMNKILSKYKVSVNSSDTKNKADEQQKQQQLLLETLDPNDDGGHYEWDEFHKDAFVIDLKQLLHRYFEPIAERKGCSLYQAAKASTGRWLLISTLTLAFIAVLPSYITGQYWTLLVIPHLAWVLIANYWHDCLHFSLSSDWRINACLPYALPLISSPWMWYHQHVIGHHAYTNIGFKDPDLAHAPQLLREHESISWKELHQTQGTYKRLALVWSIAVSLGLNLLSDMRANVKSSYNNAVPYTQLTRNRMTVHIFGRLYYLFVMFLWPFLVFPSWKAFIWTIIPSTSFSLLFMINSQINHLTEDCADVSNTNFLKHQVVTAQDFGRDSLFCGLYSGYLNHQIEHHLFPFVNHCHLPYLAPGVEEICKKHGVTYNKADGYIDAFRKHFNHTKEMSKK